MFKPMKPPAGALTDAELKLIRLPVIASVKLDGYRASVQDGVLLSSTLKPITSKQMQAKWGRPELNGLDGEIICGDPREPGCFNRTSTATSEKASAEGCTFYVFDKFHEWMGYHDRLIDASRVVNALADPSVQIAPHMTLKTLAEIEEFEKGCGEQGYEGSMYRNPRGMYKQGRSTMTEQGLLRRKPTADGEAMIMAVEEGETNTNAAYTNELGRTKRSSAKAGKVKNGTLGNFIVRGLTVFPGVEFSISGFGTQEEAAKMWAEKDDLIDRIIKFKYQKYGSLNKPRIPVALGFRDPADITDYQMHLHAAKLCMGYECEHCLEEGRK